MPAPCDEGAEGVSRSVHLGARLLHDPRPLGDFALHEVVELLGGVVRRRVVYRVFQPLEHVGLLQRAHDFGVDPGDDAARSSVGRIQAVPADHLVPGQSCFRQRGQVRSEGGTLRAGDPQPAHPAWTCGSEIEVMANMTCTCPPTTSIMAGAAFLYGTCTRLTPAIDLNNSPARCGGVPLPDDA